MDVHKKPLRVLMVEDSAVDAELLRRGLSVAGFEADAQRVENESAYIRSLDERLDLILSDYKLPQFSGLRALELLKESGLEIPFILVSGTIGEELAVTAMQLGAADYLLKDRLTRLGPAVLGAMEQSRLRKEHRRTLEALRESEERLQRASRVGGVGIFELNHLLGKSYISPVLAEIAEIWSGRESDVLSMERVVPEDRVDFQLSVARTNDPAGDGRLDHQYRIKLDDGGIRWLRVVAQTWFTGEGATRRATRTLGTVQDITVHKKGEAALEERHRLEAQLLETAAAAPGLMFTFRVQGDGAMNFPYISEKIREMLCLDPLELSRDASSFFELVHPEDLDELKAVIQREVETAVPQWNDFRIRTPGGEMIWLAGNATARREADGGMLLHGLLLDITQRKWGEVALQQSEERFRQLAENVHEVFWMSDPANSQMLYVSPAYEEIWDRTCVSLYANPESRLDAVHPDDRERVRDAAHRKLGVAGYDEIYRIVRPDGATRWIHDRAFPVHDEHGEVYRIVGTAEDITERKQLENQFLRAQRLEAIGTLSSGIAHDLNNILAPTMMVVSLLREKLSDPADLDLLTMVEQGAERGANIIKQLLTFSRGIGGDRGLVQPRHLLREMFALMRETFPREIKIIDNTPSDLPPIVADATQLTQVIMNLCVNARDAMPAGGKLTLSAYHTILRAEDTSIHVAAKPGPYVVLSVADTGEGIPAGLIDRIFEPFFTTKDVGKGTGLGLSTVMGIAKSHGGFITVYSEPGRGSLFKVYLPAGDAGAVTVPPAPSSPLPSGQNQLVLVVDDEPAIRQAIAQTLERNQYRVVSASDGKDGLTAFLEHRSRIRLVLTDVMMPVMGGVALVRTIRSLEPKQRIIAMSGLNDEDRSDELAELGVDVVLLKPCGPVELLEALHRKLEVCE